ncbi:MAG: hypothetical protein ACLFNK_01935 [Candidatus Woesearchaeota archaeon]
MRSYKAQGMSFNFIVMIAIALIVMFVVIGIFTSRADEGNQNLQSCEARGGVCVDQDTCLSNSEPEASETPMIGAHCFDDGEDTPNDDTCCIREEDEEEPEEEPEEDE